MMMTQAQIMLLVVNKVRINAELVRPALAPVPSSKDGKRLGFFSEQKG